MVIAAVSPCVDDGRWNAKALLHSPVDVQATIFADQESTAISAAVHVVAPSGRQLLRPMHPVGAGMDRWHAAFEPDELGPWSFRIEAWIDPLATCRRSLLGKQAAGGDPTTELDWLAEVVREGRAGLPTDQLTDLLERVNRATSRGERGETALLLCDALEPAAQSLRGADVLSRSHPLLVEAPLAGHGAWYTMFPRSEGSDGTVSGTFASAADALAEVAAMGFDVVYLAPIHPIGRTNRKGRDNAPVAAPGDPGSPWAIGSAEGGHLATHPDLGSLADFAAFVDRAGSLGLRVALDFALNCSPDHPWVRERPHWFHQRPDGSLRCAESDSGLYRDIVTLDVTGPASEEIKAETVRILNHWIGLGAAAFRVDMPHGKPLRFWQDVMDKVRHEHPAVVFLAEALTRPTVQDWLSKIGFSQSYTYFTWRTDKAELEEFLAGLDGERSAFFRPNLIVNTPDYLMPYLRDGGEPAFRVRAVIASMASPNWGMSAGFEFAERRARGPRQDRYADSEKYQYRPRNRRTAPLSPLLTRLNAIRHAHSALGPRGQLRLQRADNDQILVFSRQFEADIVLVVVNLDPANAQRATVTLDLAELGLGDGTRLRAHDELTGETYDWSGRQTVHLDPAVRPAHVLTLYEQP
ncbi:maltotransferase domain-containing protein [Micromonospora inyonensis]|uniref:maltotransferase domain-containing protein n=1 Tax=Micromonospora inyonensis TaxID=47866 RepID=UPI00159F30C3|nr:maltotransferase domain-containing protein [Micromonospora inyonensis]